VTALFYITEASNGALFEQQNFEQEVHNLPML